MREQKDARPRVDALTAPTSNNQSEIFRRAPEGLEVIFSPARNAAQKFLNRVVMKRVRDDVEIVLEIRDTRGNTY
jgi:hypothetical protein